jgi:hypothetical protein
MIIDASNYAANRPKAGDKVLNEKGEPIAVVLSIRKTRDPYAFPDHAGDLLVKSLRYGHTHRLGPPHQDWEDWLESGGKLLREEEGETR